MTSNRLPEGQEEEIYREQSWEKFIMDNYEYLGDEFIRDYEEFIKNYYEYLFEK